MKKYVFALFLLSCGIFSGQEVTHDLGEFTEIKVYNGLEITLKQAKLNKAITTGKNRNDVIFKIDQGILKVRMSIDEILDEDDDTKVILYFKKLNKIDAHQNSSILVQSILERDFLHLNASEGANIFTEVNLNKLYVDVNTGGEIEIEGKTEEQEVSINTGGKFYAKNLKSTNVEISIKAGGVADITSSGNVDAKVRAGGTVNVYGNPKTIDKSTLFGGKVVRKN